MVEQARKKRFLWFISLIVVVALTTTTLAQDCFAQGIQGIRGEEGRQESRGRGESAFDPKLPSSLGKVVEAFLAGERYPTISGAWLSNTVFLIQDAHAIPEAQESIRLILDFLTRRLSDSASRPFIALEGVSRKLDPTLLRLFPHRVLLEKVIHDYLRTGDLAGVAAASLLNPQEVDYYGIEDEALYDKGIQAFLRALQEKEKLLHEIQEAQSRLDARKRGVYSEKLLSLDNFLKRFDDNELGLAEFLKFLAEIKKPVNFRLVAFFAEEFVSKRGFDRDAAEAEARALLAWLRSLGLTREEEMNLNQWVQAYQTHYLSLELYAKNLWSLGRKKISSIEYPAGSVSGYPSSASPTGRARRAQKPTSDVLPYPFPPPLLSGGGVKGRERIRSTVPLTLSLSPERERGDVSTGGVRGREGTNRNERLGPVLSRGGAKGRVSWWGEVYPHLARAARTQRFLERMQIPEFFRQLEAYVEEVKSSLFRSEEERQIDEENSRLRLLRKLASLELTRDEWEGMKKLVNPSSDGPPSPLPSPPTGGRGEGEGRDFLSPAFVRAVTFYQNAEAREQAMIADFLKLRERKDTPAILVLGGFHTPAFTKRFKELNIPYVLIQPKMSRVPKETRYFDLMRGEVSWRDYFHVKNGRIQIYESFVKATVEKLIGLRPLTHTLSPQWGGEGSLPAARLPDGQGQAEVRGGATSESATPYPFSLWQSAHWREGPDPRRLLKTWRDQLILELARKKEIERASEYTRFLDEAARGQVSPSAIEEIKAEWREKLNRFTDGLKDLVARRELNRDGILRLLGKPTIPFEFANPLAPGESADRSIYSGGVRLRGSLMSEHPLERENWGLSGPVRSEGRDAVAGTNRRALFPELKTQLENRQQVQRPLLPSPRLISKPTVNVVTRKPTKRVLTGLGKGVKKLRAQLRAIEGRQERGSNSIKAEGGDAFVADTSQKLPQHPRSETLLRSSKSEASSPFQSPFFTRRPTPTAPAAKRNKIILIRQGNKVKKLLAYAAASVIEKMFSIIRWIKSRLDSVRKAFRSAIVASIVSVYSRLINIILLLMKYTGSPSQPKLTETRFEFASDRIPSKVATQATLVRARSELRRTPISPARAHVKRDREGKRVIYLERILNRKGGYDFQKEMLEVLRKTKVEKLPDRPRLAVDAPRGEAEPEILWSTGGYSENGYAEEHHHLRKHWHPGSPRTYTYETKVQIRTGLPPPAIWRAGAGRPARPSRLSLRNLQIWAGRQVAGSPTKSPQRRAELRTVPADRLDRFLAEPVARRKQILEGAARLKTKEEIDALLNRFTDDNKAEIARMQREILSLAPSDLEELRGYADIEREELEKELRDLKTALPKPVAAPTPAAALAGPVAVPPPVAPVQAGRPDREPLRTFARVNSGETIFVERYGYGKFLSRSGGMVEIKFETIPQEPAKKFYGTSFQTFLYARRLNQEERSLAPVRAHVLELARLAERRIGEHRDLRSETTQALLSELGQAVRISGAAGVERVFNDAIRLLEAIHVWHLQATTDGARHWASAHEEAQELLQIARARNRRRGTLYRLAIVPRMLDKYRGSPIEQAHPNVLFEDARDLLRLLHERDMGRVSVRSLTQFEVAVLYSVLGLAVYLTHFEHFDIQSELNSIRSSSEAQDHLLKKVFSGDRLNERAKDAARRSAMNREPFRSAKPAAKKRAIDDAFRAVEQILLEVARAETPPPAVEKDKRAELRRGWVGKTEGFEDVGERISGGGVSLGIGRLDKRQASREAIPAGESPLRVSHSSFSSFLGGQISHAAMNITNKIVHMMALPFKLLRQIKSLKRAPLAVRLKAAMSPLDTRLLLFTANSFFTLIARVLLGRYRTVFFYIRQEYFVKNKIDRGMPSRTTGAWDENLGPESFKDHLLKEPEARARRAELRAGERPPLPKIARSFERLETVVDAYLGHGEGIEVISLPVEGWSYPMSQFETGRVGRQIREILESPEIGEFSLKPPFFFHVGNLETERGMEKALFIGLSRQNMRSLTVRFQRTPSEFLRKEEAKGESVLAVVKLSLAREHLRSFLDDVLGLRWNWYVPRNTFVFLIYNLIFEGEGEKQYEKYHQTIEPIAFLLINPNGIIQIPLVENIAPFQATSDEDWAQIFEVFEHFGRTSLPRALFERHEWLPREVVHPVRYEKVVHGLGREPLILSEYYPIFEVRKPFPDVREVVFEVSFDLSGYRQSMGRWLQFVHQYLPILGRVYHLLTGRQPGIEFKIGHRFFRREASQEIVEIMRPEEAVSRSPQGVVEILEPFLRLIQARTQGLRYDDPDWLFWQVFATFTPERIRVEMNRGQRFLFYQKDLETGEEVTRGEAGVLTHPWPQEVGQRLSKLAFLLAQDPKQTDFLRPLSDEDFERRLREWLQARSELRAGNFVQMTPEVAAPWLEGARIASADGTQPIQHPIHPEHVLHFPGDYLPPLRLRIEFDPKLNGLVARAILGETDKVSKQSLVFPLTDGVPYYQRRDDDPHPIRWVSTPSLTGHLRQGEIDVTFVRQSVLSLFRELTGADFARTLFPLSGENFPLPKENFLFLGHGEVPTGKSEGPWDVFFWPAYGSSKHKHRSFLGRTADRKKIADLFVLNEKGEVSAILEFGKHRVWDILKKWKDTALLLAQHGFRLAPDLALYVTDIKVVHDKDRISYSRKFDALARSLLRILGPQFGVKTIHFVELAGDVIVTYDAKKGPKLKRWRFRERTEQGLSYIMRQREVQGILGEFVRATQAVRPFPQWVRSVLARVEIVYLQLRSFLRSHLLFLAFLVTAAQSFAQVNVRILFDWGLNPFHWFFMSYLLASGFLFASFLWKFGTEWVRTGAIQTFKSWRPWQWILTQDEYDAFQQLAHAKKAGVLLTGTISHFLSRLPFFYAMSFLLPHEVLIISEVNLVLSLLWLRIWGKERKPASFKNWLGFSLILASTFFIVSGVASFGQLVFVLEAFSNRILSFGVLMALTSAFLFSWHPLIQERLMAGEEEARIQKQMPLLTEKLSNLIGLTLTSFLFVALSFVIHWGGAEFLPTPLALHVRDIWKAGLFAFHPLLFVAAFLQVMAWVLWHNVIRKGFFPQRFIRTRALMPIFSLGWSLLLGVRGLTLTFLNAGFTGLAFLGAYLAAREESAQSEKAGLRHELEPAGKVSLRRAELRAKPALAEVRKLIRQLNHERLQVFMDASRRPPGIFVAGSARVPRPREKQPVHEYWEIHPVHEYWEMAEEGGEEIWRLGLFLITGGGPGLMEAVSKRYVEMRGGRRRARPTWAARISLPFEATVSPYAEMVSKYERFIMRKLALYENTLGVIILPGGFGTEDEMFEVWRRGRPLVILEPKRGHFHAPILRAFNKSWENAGLLRQIKETRIEPLVTHSIPKALDYIQQTSKRSPPQTLDIRQVEQANLEIEQGLRELARWPRSIVMIGKPLRGSRELRIARGLVYRLVTDFHVPIRVASRGPLFDRLHQFAVDHDWIHALQAVLFLSDLDKPLTTNERVLAKLGHGLVVEDPSNHQFLLGYGSDAFVFLPGGVGTMNKLFDILQIMQTRKVTRRPILLLGREFWQPIKEAMVEQMLSEEDPVSYISPGDESLLIIVDTVDEAIGFLREFEVIRSPGKRRRAHRSELRQLGLKQIIGQAEKLYQLARMFLGTRLLLLSFAIIASRAAAQVIAKIVFQNYGVNPLQYLFTAFTFANGFMFAILIAQTAMEWSRGSPFGRWHPRDLLKQWTLSSREYTAFRSLTLREKAGIVLNGVLNYTIPAIFFFYALSQLSPHVVVVVTQLQLVFTLLFIAVRIRGRPEERVTRGNLFGVALLILVAFFSVWYGTPDGHEDLFASLASDFLSFGFVAALLTAFTASLNPVLRRLLLIGRENETEIQRDMPLIMLKLGYLIGWTGISLTFVLLSAALMLGWERFLPTQIVADIAESILQGLFWPHFLIIVAGVIFAFAWIAQLNLLKQPQFGASRFTRLDGSRPFFVLIVSKILGVQGVPFTLSQFLSAVLALLGTYFGARDVNHVAPERKEALKEADKSAKRAELRTSIPPVDPLSIDRAYVEKLLDAGQFEEAEARIRASLEAFKRADEKVAFGTHHRFLVEVLRILIDRIERAFPHELQFIERFFTELKAGKDLPRTRAIIGTAQALIDRRKTGERGGPSDIRHIRYLNHLLGHQLLSGSQRIALREIGQDLRMNGLREDPRVLDVFAQAFFRANEARATHEILRLAGPELGSRILARLTMSERDIDVLVSNIRRQLEEFLGVPGIERAELRSFLPEIREELERALAISAPALQDELLRKIEAEDFAAYLEPVVEALKRAIPSWREILKPKSLSPRDILFWILDLAWEFFVMAPVLLLLNVPGVVVILSSLIPKRWLGRVLGARMAYAYLRQLRNELSGSNKVAPKRTQQLSKRIAMLELWKHLQHEQAEVRSLALQALVSIAHAMSRGELRVDPRDPTFEMEGALKDAKHVAYLERDLRSMTRMYPDAPRVGALEALRRELEIFRPYKHFAVQLEAFETLQALERQAIPFNLRIKTDEALARFYRETPLVSFSLPKEVRIHQERFDLLPEDFLRRYVTVRGPRALKNHISPFTYHIVINGRTYFFGHDRYLRFEFPNGDVAYLYDNHNLLYAFLATELETRQVPEGQKVYVHYDYHPDDVPLPTSLRSARLEASRHPEIDPPFVMAQLHTIGNFVRSVMTDRLGGWRYVWVRRLPVKIVARTKNYGITPQRTHVYQFGPSYITWPNYHDRPDLADFQKTFHGGIGDLDWDMVVQGKGREVSYDEAMILYQGDRPHLLAQLPTYEILAFFTSDDRYISPIAAIHMFADLFPRIAIQKLTPGDVARAELRLPADSEGGRKLVPWRELPRTAIVDYESDPIYLKPDEKDPLELVSPILRLNEFRYVPREKQSLVLQYLRWLRNHRDAAYRRYLSRLSEKRGGKSGAAPSEREVLETVVENPERGMSDIARLLESRRSLVEYKLRTAFQEAVVFTKARQQGFRSLASLRWVMPRGWGLVRRAQLDRIVRLLRVKNLKDLQGRDVRSLSKKGVGGKKIHPVALSWIRRALIRRRIHLRDVKSLKNQVADLLPRHGRDRVRPDGVSVREIDLNPRLRRRIAEYLKELRVNNPTEYENFVSRFDRPTRRIGQTAITYPELSAAEITTVLELPTTSPSVKQVRITLKRFYQAAIEMARGIPRIERTRAELIELVSGFAMRKKQTFREEEQDLILEYLRRLQDENPQLFNEYRSHLSQPEDFPGGKGLSERTAISVFLDQPGITVPEVAEQFVERFTNLNTAKASLYRTLTPALNEAVLLAKVEKEGSRSLAGLLWETPRRGTFWNRHTLESLIKALRIRTLDELASVSVQSLGKAKIGRARLSWIRRHLARKGIFLTDRRSLAAQVAGMIPARGRLPHAVPIVTTKGIRLSQTLTRRISEFLTELETKEPSSYERLKNHLTLAEGRLLEVLKENPELSLSEIQTRLKAQGISVPREEVSQDFFTAIRETILFAAASEKGPRSLEALFWEVPRFKVSLLRKELVRLVLELGIQDVDDFSKVRPEDLERIPALRPEFLEVLRETLSKMPGRFIDISGLKARPLRGEEKGFRRRVPSPREIRELEEETGVRPKGKQPKRDPSRILSPRQLTILLRLGFHGLVTQELSYLSEERAKQKGYPEVWRRLLREGGVPDLKGIEEAYRRVGEDLRLGRYRRARVALEKLVVLEKLYALFEPGALEAGRAPRILSDLSEKLTSIWRRRKLHRLLSAEEVRKLLGSQRKASDPNHPRWRSFTGIVTTDGAGRFSFGAGIFYPTGSGKGGRAFLQREFDPELFLNLSRLIPANVKDRAHGNTYYYDDLVAGQVEGAPIPLGDRRLIQQASDWQEKTHFIAEQIDPAVKDPARLHRRDLPGFETLYRTNDSGDVTFKSKIAVLFRLRFPPNALFKMARSWQDPLHRHVYAFVLLDDEGRMVLDEAGNFDLRLFALEKKRGKTRFMAAQVFIDSKGTFRPPAPTFVQRRSELRIWKEVRSFAKRYGFWVGLVSTAILTVSGYVQLIRTGNGTLLGYAGLLLTLLFLAKAYELYRAVRMRHKPYRVLLERIGPNSWRTESGRGIYQFGVLEAKKDTAFIRDLTTPLYIIRRSVQKARAELRSDTKPIAARLASEASKMGGEIPSVGRKNSYLGKQGEVLVSRDARLSINNVVALGSNIPEAGKLEDAAEFLIRDGGDTAQRVIPLGEGNFTMFSGNQRRRRPAVAVFGNKSILPQNVFKSSYSGGLLEKQPDGRTQAVSGLVNGISTTGNRELGTEADEGFSFLEDNRRKFDPSHGTQTIARGRTASKPPRRADIRRPADDVWRAELRTGSKEESRAAQAIEPRGLGSRSLLSREPSVRLAHRGNTVNETDPSVESKTMRPYEDFWSWALLLSFHGGERAIEMLGQEFEQIGNEVFDPETGNYRDSGWDFSGPDQDLVAKAELRRAGVRKLIELGAEEFVWLGVFGLAVGFAAGFPALHQEYRQTYGQHYDDETKEREFSRRHRSSLSRGIVQNPTVQLTTARINPMAAILQLIWGAAKLLIPVTVAKYLAMSINVLPVSYRRVRLVNFYSLLYFLIANLSISDFIRFLTRTHLSKLSSPAYDYRTSLSERLLRVKNKSQNIYAENKILQTQAPLTSVTRKVPSVGERLPRIVVGVESPRPLRLQKIADQTVTEVESRGLPGFLESFDRAARQLLDRAEEFAAVAPVGRAAVGGLVSRHRAAGAASASLAEESISQIPEPEVSRIQDAIRRIAVGAREVPPHPSPLPHWGRGEGEGVNVTQSNLPISAFGTLVVDLEASGLFQSNGEMDSEKAEGLSRKLPENVSLVFLVKNQGVFRERAVKLIQYLNRLDDEGRKGRFETLIFDETESERSVKEIEKLGRMEGRRADRQANSLVPGGQAADRRSTNRRTALGDQAAKWGLTNQRSFAFWLSDTLGQKLVHRASELGTVFLLPKVGREIRRLEGIEIEFLDFLPLLRDLAQIPTESARLRFLSELGFETSQGPIDLTASHVLLALARHYAQEREEVKASA